ncbi:hypothetical protein [Echinicola rosea]|uniref:hypothetical protein n=1 Tax=Echinicola rosea TaxID=1807691 RepID=UPI0010CA8B55|nr:hypothetical protein [Echinicola rosea]
MNFQLWSSIFSCSLSHLPLAEDDIEAAGFSLLMRLRASIAPSAVGTVHLFGVNIILAYEKCNFHQNPAVRYL